MMQWITVPQGQISDQAGDGRQMATVSMVFFYVFLKLPLMTIQPAAMVISDYLTLFNQQEFKAFDVDYV